jgi:hypothetical protein
MAIGKNYVGTNALHLAAEYGHQGTVKLLLDKMPQAFLAMKTEKGFNALHLAAMHGHKGVVSELVTRMTSDEVSEKTHDNRTAHDLAVKRPCRNEMDLLKVTDILQLLGSATGTPAGSKESVSAYGAAAAPIQAPIQSHSLLRTKSVEVLGQEFSRTKSRIQFVS